MKKSYESGVGAAMLADVPAGKSPAVEACFVATVVIPGGEKGVRLDDDLVILSCVTIEAV
jgi:hypothetical protein